MEQFSSKFVFRQHAPYSFGDYPFGIYFHHFLIGSDFGAAGISGVPEILFIDAFSAGNFDLFSIDDYDVVAEIPMR